MENPEAEVVEEQDIIDILAAQGEGVDEHEDEELLVLWELEELELLLLVLIELELLELSMQLA